VTDMPELHTRLLSEANIPVTYGPSGCCSPVPEVTPGAVHRSLAVGEAQTDGPVGAEGDAFRLGAGPAESGGQEGGRSAAEITAHRPGERTAPRR
jgi:hypothetical protein